MSANRTCSTDPIMLARRILHSADASSVKYHSQHQWQCGGVVVCNTGNAYHGASGLWLIQHGALHALLPVVFLLQVRALFPFDAEAEGELSVAVGDSLWVEAEVDGWYQVVRDGDGARGLVPTSYVDVEQF